MVTGCHSPGKPVQSGNLRVVREKSGEMCSDMCSVTASIVLDRKYARKEFFTG